MRPASMAISAGHRSAMPRSLRRSRCCTKWRKRNKHRARRAARAKARSHLFLCGTDHRAALSIRWIKSEGIHAILTASQNFPARVSCDRSGTAWASREGPDKRDEQSSAHGCDRVRDVAFRPQGRSLWVGKLSDMEDCESSVAKRGPEGGIVSCSEIRNP